VAKHRNGPVGMVELYFDEQKVSFRNLDTTFEFSESDMI
jgi:replicative DNA helicase